MTVRRTRQDLAVRAEPAAFRVIEGMKAAQGLTSAPADEVGGIGAPTLRGHFIGFTHAAFSVHEHHDERRVFVNRGQLLFMIPDGRLRPVALGDIDAQGQDQQIAVGTERVIIDLIGMAI